MNGKKDQRTTIASKAVTPSDDEVKTLMRKAITEALPSCTKAERAVLGLIVDCGPISQQTIANHERWLGSDPRHEKQSRATTVRNIRGIVKDIICERGIPICSSIRSGFFLPETWDEVVEDVSVREGRAKSMFDSAMETRTAIEKTFGIEIESQLPDLSKGFGEQIFSSSVA